MQFGDEGKGTFVDYLAHEQDADLVVRYNGGSQASHTVITPSGELHKFSQLGSGMFSEGCHTCLTENTVINPDNLMVEADIFAFKTGIPLPALIDRLHIHENCFIVTPYHKLINKLRELSKGDRRRGTVGTGVSEVRYLLTEPRAHDEELLGLQIKDLFDPVGDTKVTARLQALERYVSAFYREHADVIWQSAPEHMRETLEKEIACLLRPQAPRELAWGYAARFREAPQALNLRRRLYSSYEQTVKSGCRCAVFEGSQGLLIDGTYGIKPNTTHLDTTAHFARTLCGEDDTTVTVGVIKAFTSRHGQGLFPTESPELSACISDGNQETSFWNGGIRFGWFDAVLFRYAQRINRVQELYLSSLDLLDELETIGVCDAYRYHGTVDARFDELFVYSTSDGGEITVTDIRGWGEDVGQYLENCTPMYRRVCGWQSDISHITERAQLPEACIAYVRLLEQITGLPITVISVGPTRNHKIRM